MSRNFVFFDTETSGTNTYFGQIFQFAAILTDETFRVLDKFEIRSKRMSHIIPEPGAMLVTGIAPEQLECGGHSYYEFASLIRQKLLEWSPATFCGYNSLNFDEPYMRSMYYQNLYPPYLSQTNGNTRIDVLPMVRAAENLFPKALIFPLNEKGKTSKKLEHIAASNGFENHNAHDAMGDVLATLHVAKIIATEAPILWDNCNRSSSRLDFNNFIANERWVLVHDNNNGWPVTYPGVAITKIDNGRNSLFYDLRYPLQKVIENDIETNFMGRERPFRVVRDSNMPIIFSRKDLDKITFENPVDLAYLDGLANDVKSDASVITAASMHSEIRKEYDKSPYIETQIYENFNSFQQDQPLMEKFHDACPKERAAIAEQFSDNRFRSFARRIIFENFPETMTETEICEFKTRICERIISGENVPWTTLENALLQCDSLLEQGGFPEGDIATIREYLEELRIKSANHLESDQTSGEPTNIEKSRAIKTTRLSKAKEEKQRYEALKAKLTACFSGQSLDAISESKIRDILYTVNKPDGQE